MTMLSEETQSYLEEEDGQLSLRIQTYEAEPKAHYWVNQSREMINAKNDLDLTERRLIFSIVSLVQPHETEFKTYTLQIRDLANLLGISDSNFYGQVEKAIDRLQSKQLVIENNRILQKITWVQSATYIKGEGRVIIKLSEDLAPYLRDLKTYTKYRLYNVLQLRSEYSWTMYELLKERQFRKERIFKIDELRYLLNIGDKYKQIKHIRALIDNIKEELEEKTDIWFEYDVYKRVGRRIESFIFRIHQNLKNRNSALTAEAANYDAHTVLNLLIKNGIHQKKAKLLAKQYHPAYIEENVRHALRINVDQDIRNKSGFIISAIENNYANSTYELEQYDNPFFDMELSSAAGYLEETTKQDIESLKEIVDAFRKDIMPKMKDASDIEKVTSQLQHSLIKKIQQIQLRRKKDGIPFLLYEDVEHHHYINRAYESWQEGQSE
jgi:plasmid replication initiation protein